MKSPQKKNSILKAFACVFSLLICITFSAVNSNAQKSVSNLPVFKPDTNQAIAPAPIFVSGNPSCAELNASANPAFANITSDYELKLDSPLAPFNGTFQYINNPPNQFLIGTASSSNTITTSTSGNTLTFSSTLGISAVIVKGGPDANVYVYPTATFGDTGLTTPRDGRFGISHISICYYVPASVTIIKEVQTFPSGTASTQSFGFMSSSNFGTTNFSLVDNDSQPADRRTNSAIYSFGAGNAITVTENMTPGWSLTDINCVSTAGGGLPNIGNNTTVNLGSRTANIVLEQGENVTCTFRNGQVAPSAASASVSGRVLTETGLPLRRAAVTVFNANTLETLVVYTNSLGYYRVDNLAVNNFYILTVSHGKRTFANNSHSFTLDDNLAEVNFFASY